MSILGAVGIASSFQTLLQSIKGGAAVTLGGIQLEGLEVPETISWGGEHRLAVHDLVGGGRVVRATGPSDADISWAGMFSGADAVDRANAIDALRVSGRQVPLSWAGFRRNVVVKTFRPRYAERGALIRYDLTVVVVTVVSAPPPTLASSVRGDLSSSLGFSGLPTGVTTAVSAAQSALPVASVLTRGSPGYGSLQTAVGLAASSASGSASAADALIAQSALAQSRSGGIGGPTGILALVAASGTLAASTNAAGFLGRASRNLA